MISKRIFITCPGCKQSFWSTHGNREYCSPICNNRHYNKLYRDKSRNYLETLERNINILNSLMEDKYENIFPFLLLNNRGFNFHYYSEKLPFRLNHSLFYIVYGQYITNLVEEESIKVKLN